MVGSRVALTNPFPPKGCPPDSAPVMETLKNKWLTVETHSAFGSWPGLWAIRWRRFRTHRRLLRAGFRSIRRRGPGKKLHAYWFPPATGNRVFVFLHGYLDSAQTFRQVFPKLRAAGHGIFSLDLPGFGYSTMEPIPELWQPPVLAEVCRSFLETLEPDRYRLSAVGHSLGGYMALEIQRQVWRYSGRQFFDRLHLVAPGIIAHPERDKIRHLLFPQSRDDVRALLANIYHRKTPELSEWILDGILRFASRREYYYLAENIIEKEEEMFFDHGRLKDMPGRFALYWGGHDRVTPREYGQKTRRIFGGRARWHLFPNLGHAPQSEDGEHLADSLLWQEEQWDHPVRSRRGKNTARPAPGRKKSRKKAQKKKRKQSRT